MMMHLQLSGSSVEVLRSLFENNRPLYVNEIVRGTGLYPNAVQRSLATLEKQNLVTSAKLSNKRFYTLNNDHKHISVVRSIATDTVKRKINDYKDYKYIKWVSRECSVALNAAIGSAQCDTRYIKKFRIEPVDFLWYNSITGGVYNSIEQVRKTGMKISREIKKDSSFARQLADDCISDGNKLIDETLKIKDIDISQLTEKQLYRMLNKLYELFLHFMPYYVIPHAIENAIETELYERVFDESFKQKLIEPVEILSEEQVDELELADEVKKNGWTKSNENKLLTLTNKYCWLPMMALHHQPFDIKHFRKVVDELVVSVEDPKKELIRLQKQQKTREKELENALDKIKADSKLRNLVYTTQAYLNLRTYRVNITKKFHYHHLSLLYEIAKRINISKEDIAFLTYDEILSALRDEKNRKDLHQLISERKIGFVNITWKGKTRVISGVKNIIQAMEQYQISAGTPEVKKEVYGNSACKGVVTGRVKIVNKLPDLSKVNAGDILVAKMTTPDYMIAVNKAAAIITDEGGITCHAAIVSREFNIPCIVGTKNATQLLNDNDIVEVNANEGIVRVVESTMHPQDTREFRGKTIYKGRVKGKARIITDASDFEKLHLGDIVIALQTTPEYLSLLYRAKGFVVDEESITSHAVLYGRALEIPSVMGTLYARNIIKDGETIILDATNGIVKRTE